MGWFKGRARRRRQAELDAITKVFGFDSPETFARYERDQEEARLIDEAELRRREIELLDAHGNPRRPKPAADSE